MSTRYPKHAYQHMRQNNLNFGLLFLAGLTFLAILLSGCKAKKNSVKEPVPDILLWSASQSDIATLLSQEPNECLQATKTIQEKHSIVLGRLAFRSPFLLGGQAARRGLTCQACHGQGQTNTHFFVKGLSNEPGTADVTSFHFSDVLGDESFNPVPIPSLSDSDEIVDFDPSKTDLDIFVTRLITKEFTGPLPSQEVKSALLSYLRALDDDTCTVKTLSTTRLMSYKLDIISESFSVLTSEGISQDTLNFMVAALRQEIGRLHVRFPRHKTFQQELEKVSQTLNARGGNIDLESVQSASMAWNNIKLLVPKYYEQSLFNPKAIKKWDEARR